MFFCRSICVDCSFYFPLSFTLSLMCVLLLLSIPVRPGWVPCVLQLLLHMVFVMVLFINQSLYASCLCVHHMYGSVDYAYDIRCLSIVLDELFVHFFPFPFTFYLLVDVWDPTSFGEENEIFFTRVWKPPPSRRVLKTLRGS